MLHGVVRRWGAVAWAFVVTLPRMNQRPPPSSSPSLLAQRTVNLALQGGGSHGAFTWGVLDALLEDGRLGLEGISGTSAGAMNAVALAHGFAQAQERPGSDAREQARESLARFWNGIVDMGALSELQRAPFELLFGPHSLAHSAGNWAQAMLGAWAQSVSPYQANPFDINPLRHFLEKRWISIAWAG